MTLWACHRRPCHLSPRLYHSVSFVVVVIMICRNLWSSSGHSHQKEIRLCNDSTTGSKKHTQEDSRHKTIRMKGMSLILKRPKLRSKNCRYSSISISIFHHRSMVDVSMSIRRCPSFGVVVFSNRRLVHSVCVGGFWMGTNFCLLSLLC